MNGIFAVENGVGDITVTASGAVTGSSARGIFAEENTTGTGNILINGSGNVTGGGATFGGIVAQNLNSANNGNITVSQTGNISGGRDGIRVQTNGNGNLNVSTGANSSITGSSRYGIEAAAIGSGKISITTATGDIISSGSSAIEAVNEATSVDVSAGSSVTVTAKGTIQSGTNVNAGGFQPQGISAGFFGSNGTSNTNINGTVLVDNFANITAAAGWGINAYNFGNGSVTVTDEANTNVSGAQFGIAAGALSSGVGSSGSVTINVGSGATVTAGSLYGLTAIPPPKTMTEVSRSRPTALSPSRRRQAI